MSVDDFIENLITTIVRDELVSVVQKELTELRSFRTQDEWLLKEEVADMLKVSVSTVDNLRRSGKIQGHRIGEGTKSPIRFLRSEIEKAIINQ